MQWLLLAERWKAILLIDDCEVFKGIPSKVMRQLERLLRLTGMLQYFLTLSTISEALLF